jgi:hypothetical protein
MSYRVKNTSTDRNKAHLHRVAPKFIEEPSLCGERLRLGTSVMISDSQYEINKVTLASWEAKGMVEVTKLEEAWNPPNDPKLSPEAKVAEDFVEGASDLEVPVVSDDSNVKDEVPVVEIHSKKGRKKLV